ncbi:DMT family transporter [Psychrobacillus lasiicapitis]|uniref:EamA/RhaT family transporter n=1 Tax=Psychrobacillus lasiicapitis TaxID=1636719 RepID=A0A544T4V5_9BACI|nr:DMT family transporter [Psychrobacillus lasiicapitis]TQR12480.1 EamA/RhaT family transporter [Psychrobacillus lasiicapitis]GGA38466.1 transporter [Psychrobacillus lasiicapitis]
MNGAAMFKMTLSMAIFGSIGFFTGKTGIPAVELVFVRCICATLFLGFCWFITGQHKVEVWNKREVIQTLICGVFLVLNWVFLFKAFEEMSITVAISIYNLAPIFVLILGSLFLKEKLTFTSLLAIIVCFLGSIFIIGIQNFTSLTDFMGSGFVWALLSALCYALTMLLGKGINGLSAYAMTFVQTIIGILILLPIVSFDVFRDLSGSNWLYILGTGLIHTGFVYYLFFDSLRKLSTVVISALVFVDPVVAILLDTLILNFRPSILQTIGILLIFGGIIYTLIKPGTNPKMEV